MKKITPWWNVSGYFDLSDTDNHVGSLFSVEDMMVILSILPERRELFCEMLRRGNLLNEEGKIIEPELNNNNNWKCLMKFCSQESPKYSQSLFELELKAVIEKVYGPDVSVNTQFAVKTQSNNRCFHIDLKATYKDKDYYIEFLGPQHFDDDKIEKDILRNKKIESEIGTNIIEWPYWIQLCERNVRIAFGEKQLQGKGALWSTRYLWGGVSEKVKQRIIDLSNEFNAIHEDGLGYIYERWVDDSGNEIKPEHPILDDNNNKKRIVDYLIPANVGKDKKKFWLPSNIWNRICN